MQKDPLDNDEVTIIECRVPYGLKGLYADGFIALQVGMTRAERNCIIAEELGHHYTTCGNILDQSALINEKQELRARAWAYEKLLPLHQFVSAFENGCRNRFEVADFLDMTEEFISGAVEYYKRKHGLFTLLESGHVIYLEPLGVMKKL